MFNDGIPHTISVGELALVDNGLVALQKCQLCQLFN